MGEYGACSVPTKDGLRIGYLNVNGAENKINQIEYLAHRYQLDIFFVAETKLVKKKQASTGTKVTFEHVDDSFVQIAEYKMVQRKDREDNTGGGLIVYVKQDICNRYVIEAQNDDSVDGAEHIHILANISSWKTSGSISVTGVYIPTPVRKEDSRYKELLGKLEKHNNALLIGDVNKEKENVPPDSKQLIHDFTRVQVNLANGTLHLSEKAIDHIYVQNLNDVKVVESGAMHCGISDHALVYCTVLPRKHKGQLSPSFIKSGDLIQHDVPRLLSALIAGGDYYDKLTIKSPKFWVMARTMETKRIEISELIHKLSKNQEDLEALQKIQKSPVDFCKDLNTRVRDLESLFKSSIENARMGRFDTSPSQKPIYDELEWYLNTGVRSNKVNENIFLSSRTKYLSSCFPAAQSMLTEDIRVINIQAMRTGQQPIMTQSQVDWDDASSRSGRGYRMFMQPELSNNLFGWKLAEYLLLLSPDHKNQPFPLGLIELGNFLYHLETVWEIAPKIGIFFLSNNLMGSQIEILQAMKNNVLVYPKGKALFWTLITSAKDKSNVIQTAGLKFMDLNVNSSYRSVQTLMNCESRVSQDMNKVLSALVNGTTDELEGLIAPCFWLDLPREWIMRENKQGEITKYAEEFRKEDCTTCKKMDWNTLINNIGAKHPNDTSKQCIQHWLNKIKSSIENGIMFLHSEMDYFNLHVLPDVLNGTWDGKRIVGIHTFWNCNASSPLKSIDSISEATDKSKALLLIRYEGSSNWHTDYEDEFWNQQKGIIWDDINPRQAWSEFVESIPDQYPSGASCLDNTICHRHLQYKLKDTLDTYRGDIVFTDELVAFVYMRISRTHCNSEMENVIQQIIDTIREDNTGIKRELFYTVVGDSDTKIMTDMVRQAVNDYEHLKEVSYHDISDPDGCYIEIDSSGSSSESDPDRSQSESDDSQEESAD